MTSPGPALAPVAQSRCDWSGMAVSHSQSAQEVVLLVLQYRSKTARALPSVTHSLFSSKGFVKCSLEPRIFCVSRFYPVVF